MYNFYDEQPYLCTFIGIHHQAQSVMGTRVVALLIQAAANLYYLYFVNNKAEIMYHST